MLWQHLGDARGIQPCCLCCRGCKVQAGCRLWLRRARASTSSYRIIVMLLVEERRDIDETGGHRLVILVFILILRPIEHVEHFFSRLNIHRRDILCHVVLSCVVLAYSIWLFVGAEDG